MCVCVFVSSFEARVHDFPVESPTFLVIVVDAVTMNFLLGDM